MLNWDGTLVPSEQVEKLVGQTTCPGSRSVSELRVSENC